MFEDLYRNLVIDHRTTSRDHYEADGLGEWVCSDGQVWFIEIWIAFMETIVIKT